MAPAPFPPPDPEKVSQAAGWMTDNSNYVIAGVTGLVTGVGAALGAVWRAIQKWVKAAEDKAAHDIGDVRAGMIEAQHRIERLEDRQRETELQIVALRALAVQTEANGRNLEALRAEVSAGFRGVFTALGVRVTTD